MDRYLKNLTLLYIPAICLSILQEYGYFAVIGFRFLSNLEIYDYIVGLIIIGPFIIWLAASALSGAFLENKYPSTRSKSVEKRELIHDIVFFIILFITSSSYLLFKSSIYYFTSVALLFLSLFIYIYARINLTNDIRELTLIEYITRLLAMPSILIMLSVGISHAAYDLASNSYIAKVSNDKESYFFVRSISNGIFVRDKSDTVYFYSFDRIEYLRTEKSICSAFGFWRNRVAFEIIRDYIFGDLPCMPNSLS